MISTHILDTHKGEPAPDVQVVLQKKDGDNWTDLKTDTTNNDGRIVFDCSKEKGLYRLIFEVEAYFNKSNQEHFFPTVPVIFNIQNTDRKYHVPLLLNPYGFSTYRGS